MTFQIIDNEHTAKIKVVGVGGAGGNAINRMIASGMHGVEFIAINTDGQVLETSAADMTLCIGDSITHGLGAGAKPELGRQAIEADRENVTEKLMDTDLVFITAGMGGGTGTGAAPIVAEIAREQGALTVGIVTEPFEFEGFPRMRNATNGIAELLDKVDTLIVIKNQRLLSICSRDTTLEEAFLRADEVLLQATRGIADLITIPGMINLDFMDVKTIITEGGDAIMGVGTHRGENRALEAAKKAIKSPLLEDVSIDGAKGVLINISSGSNLTLFEVNEATSVVHEAAGQEANIIFGTVIDDGLIDEIRVTVIATGFNINKEEEIDIDLQPEGKRVGDRKAKANIDIPTFIRRNSSAAGSGQAKAEERQGTPEKLEYPTFLRRKMSS
ncbi:MAG: cell division protein FtsZ [Gemmatimonadetes bacterium]|nr:cell division protein FtsZ [Gemmatimonadota bacterium]